MRSSVLFSNPFVRFVSFVVKMRGKTARSNGKKLDGSTTKSTKEHEAMEFDEHEEHEGTAG